MPLHNDRIQKLYVGTNLNQYVDADSSNSNIRFTDSTTGTKTLAQLASGSTASEGLIDYKLMGFPDKTLVNISYVRSTQTLTVTGTFHYWENGVKITKTSVTENVVHADTTGVHYFYYTGGVLTTSMVAFDLVTVQPVAIVIYNNSAESAPYWNGPDYVLIDERHGMMEGNTHLDLHTNVGAYVKGTGFALNGTYSVATGSGGLVANSFGIDSGYMKDEDLETLIATLTDNAGVGNQYACHYRTGASNEWRWYINNLPYLMGTNGVYNLNTGGTWSLSEITTNSRFMNIFICGSAAMTATTGHRFVFIIGQQQHTTLANAQANENFYTLDLTGAPFPDMVPLWQITLRRESSYASAGGFMRIEATRKIVGTRFVSSMSAGSSPTIHNNLGGRSDVSCHPIEAINASQAFAIPFENSGATGLTIDSNFTYTDSTDTLNSPNSLISTNSYIGDTNTYLSKDSNNSIKFTDAVTGSKTLADLAAGASIQFSGNTTDSNSTEIFLGGVSNSRYTIASNSVQNFNLELAAKDSVNSCLIMKYEGGIKRDSSDTTALVGTVTDTLICRDTNASSWLATITADDTNESLKVAVTGEASKIIKWAVKLTATEVKY